MKLKNQDRTILHVDINSFFATAEQQANPFLRGKSIGVGNPDYPYSAILAASYPAKWQGIGLSTRLNEAKRIDPKFELIKIDPIKYYALHKKFINILKKYSPVVEIYSIDEAFLDITNLTESRRDAWNISYAIKHEITQTLGCSITCSIGIAPNKLLAKIASDYKKPDGITAIKWKNRLELLDTFELQDIWGIGKRTANKLQNIGIKNTKQIREMSHKSLYAFVGSYTPRLRLISQGYNFDPVINGAQNTPPKSMQHAHTLETATRSKEKLLSLARKMAEKLAKRLRSSNQKASRGLLALAYSNMGEYGWNSRNWFGEEFSVSPPSNDGYTLYTFCKQIIQNFELKNNVRRITVGVFKLSTPEQSLFELQKVKRNKINTTMDQINSRFGSFSLRTADILYQYAKETELSSGKHEMRFHKDI